jgi:hypothetical protein
MLGLDVWAQFLAIFGFILAQGRVVVVVILLAFVLLLAFILLLILLAFVLLLSPPRALPVCTCNLVTMRRLFPSLGEPFPILK